MLTKIEKIPPILMHEYREHQRTFLKLISIKILVFSDITKYDLYF